MLCYPLLCYAMLGRTSAPLSQRFIMWAMCRYRYVGVLRAVIVLWLALLAFTPAANELGFAAVPVEALTAWIALSIEQLAVEIENPFGQDDNDLPLDTYLTTITADCERLLREQRVACSPD